MDRTLSDLGLGPGAQPPVSAGEYRPGTIVGGRYEIVKRRGAGGMGVVYEARDKEGGGLVALKTLKGFNPQALWRFKREFRALAGVVHPNLVRLHELVVEEGNAFFTMELLEGTDLLTYIRQGVAEGSLPNLARVRLALRQLVDGIRTLHAAGKLHRDIKPSNVMVTQEGRVIILDFGLIDELDSRPAETRLSGGRFKVAGTPLYMSPEQASGRKLTEASDIYAVGVILYRALTDHVPFEGSAQRVIAAKTASGPRRPTHWIPEIPEDLDDLCMGLLEKDPDVRLSAEEALLRLGREVSEVSITGPVSIVPGDLIGRGPALVNLRAAFEAVDVDAPVVVRMRGESGTGKSTLARHFVDRLRELDEAIVLTSRCVESEAMPYKGVDGLIDALSQYVSTLPDKLAALILPRNVRAIARLFPVLDRAEMIRGAPTKRIDGQDPHMVRAMAIEALRELLGAIADRRPLVLHIDDLQWGDPDSIDLLAELTKAPGAPSILLILSYRPEEDTSPALQKLEALNKEPTTTWCDIEVSPLPKDAAKELALRWLGSDGEGTQEQAELLAEKSAGNPLYLEELVRSVAHERHRSEGLRAQLGAVAVGTLDELVLSRLARLTDASRSLLEVIAVAGRPIDPELAVKAADVSGDQPFDSLQSEHLLRTVDVPENRVESIHDRIREIVVAHLETDHLSNVHLRLANALESAGGDPETLCEHFRKGGEPERAGKYAARAAAQASDALAFDRAVRLYRLALELHTSSAAEEGSGLPSGREVLQLRLADALANAGRGTAAAALYASLVPSAAAHTATALQHRAAEELLRSGHAERGMAALASVLDSVGVKLAATRNRAILKLLWGRLVLKLRGTTFEERDPEQIPAEDLRRVDVCWSAVHGLAAVSSIRSAEFQNRHLRMALACGEPYRVGRALTYEALFLASTPSGVSWANRLLQQAEQLGARLGNEHVLGLVALMQGYVAMLRGGWRVANAKSAAAMDHLSRCAGVSHETTLAKQLDLTSLFYLGDYTELSRRLPDHLEDAQRRGDLLAQVVVATLVSQSDLVAGDADAARAHLDETLDRWSQPGFNTPDYMRVAGHSQIDLYLGRSRSALQRWDRAWQQLERSLLTRVDFMRVFALDLRARAAVLAARESNDGSELMTRALKYAKQIRATRVAGAEGMADVITAGVAVLNEDPSTADEYLQHAVADFDAADMAAHAAMVRARRGKLLGGEAGKALEAEGLGSLSARGVADPERMTEIYVP
jgi:hypothetical protein